MTVNMTIEQMIEVMRAHENGEKIEVKEKRFNDDWSWTPYPSWNWASCDYRIKTETKYRPYKDTDELVADCETRFNKISAANSMPLIWVMHNKCKSLITDYSKCTVRVFGTFQSMSSLYDDYTYLDGSPCGKEDK